MSSSSEDNNKENNSLDQSQSNQSDVGDAATNPETSGPADNVRDQALKVTDNKSDQEISSSEDNNKENNSLDQSQSNQSDVGDAATNPETSGPADNVRDQALKVTDNKSDQE